MKELNVEGNLIKPEWPEGLRNAEMLLVKMLKEEDRCWADRMEIVDALWRLRDQAEKMRKEQEHINNAEWPAYGLGMICGTMKAQDFPPYARPDGGAKP